MRKEKLILIPVLLIAYILCSCGVRQIETDKGKIEIVTTIFPEYDWAKEIVGESENVDITLLLDNGADLHSYQPTAADIIKISDCDIFIYVGGESDKWVDGALAKAKNKDMTVLNLLEILGDKVKEEEEKEGMEKEKEEDEEEEPEYDEHVWLSLKNASALCGRIAEAICEKDPENRDIYEAKAKKYIKSLEELDKEYENAVSAANKKTLVFADRFPFRYMTEDYGISYFAAFSGCSAETEASFETIIFLANKIDELGLNSIIELERSAGSVAKTVRENTKTAGQKIIELNSMQSVSSKDILGGAAYLPIMQQNLAALKEALD